MKLKLSYVLLVLLMATFSLNAQTKPNYIGVAKSMVKTAPLSEISATATRNATTADKPYLVPNNFKTSEPTNPNALPLGQDPAAQKQMGVIPSKAPIENFPGIGSNGGVAPPDPTGAVGPNHYVQMVNLQYRIWDKSGTPLTAQTPLSALFGAGAGDPIALYDRFADRWLLSQFTDSDTNTIKIAISETQDPTGSYFLYEFQFDSFPDYFKIGIWHDGYYITANKRDNDAAFVVNRDQMLEGNPLAQLIGFSIPDIGTSSNNIFAPGPVNAIGPELPSSDQPGMITYFQDDNFAGIAQDHLKIWNINVDWEQTGNSTISSPVELVTEPFDTFFNTFGVGDIQQPGTSQRIDAVWGALMYQVHFREFDDHNSMVLNHTVDVDNTLLGGIRWYELRQDDGSSPWSIYQQGTFSPDTESRFMGSIAIDGDGAIGLAYAVSGPTVFPSLRYTGRFPGDPLGEMTLDEEVIVDGTNAQTTFTRFGDYSQLTIDPTDDLTFWFTGEYFAGGLWRTRIASFKINEEFNNDVGVAALESPQNGGLTASETVSVTIRNYGENAESNFPVSYQIDNGTVVTETFTGTIAAGDDAVFTFAQAGDFSGAGNEFELSVSTGLTTDEATFNDGINPTVKNLYANDLGIQRIVGPRSEDGLGLENIEVLIYNYGASPQTGFTLSYSLNDGTPVSETFAGTIAPETSETYTFTTDADLTATGPYDIEVATTLAGDQDDSNDALTARVIHSDCIPRSTGTTFNNGCASDGFKNFELGTIKNISGCNNDAVGVGYADFTFISTDLDKAVGDYDLTVRSGYAPEEVSIWIDFNDNGIYEASEQVLSNTTITQANVDQVFTLTIPASATLGVHTLRAKAIDAGGTGTGIDDPCGNVQWGETEDYTVNIVDTSLGLGDFTIGDNQYHVLTRENSNFDVILDLAFELSEDLDVTVYNISGQRVITQALTYETGGYKTRLDLSNQASGVYLVSLGTSTFNKTKKIIVR